MLDFCLTNTVASLRELEDIIIEMMYASIIEGKMDQHNAWLEIDSTVARDITPDQLNTISSILTDWCDNCDNVLANIEQQIVLANTMKVDYIKNKNELEANIAKVKASVKNNGQDMDDDPVNSGTPSRRDPFGGFGTDKDTVSTIDRMKRTIQRKPGPSGSGSSRNQASSSSSSKSGTWSFNKNN